MTTMWIGPDDRLSDGKVGFLVNIENPVRGTDHYELRDNPPTTNQSYRPRLRGWCGSYNDTSTWGMGMWKVERMARNGRAFIRKLDGDELQAALEEFGYPDLTDED